MAGRYPAAWLEELRARSNIVDVISAYMPLKKRGQDYWGLCPFHGEKTASFSVSPDKQFYYCFGCKASGTVIQFIMDMERLSYHEAVKLLADRAHMTLPEMEDDPDYQRRKDQRERLLAANREAALFYHQTLYTEEGAGSLSYLQRRGLSDAVIRAFGLGAAPDDWAQLTDHLRAKGFTIEELRLAGLTRVRPAEPAAADRPAQGERIYDMFRDRAMFPIIDQYGNVLGFGGRILGKGEPKYLNTSDTPVFNKRLGVYAANLLKKERHLDRVILVEGYMDVVALTQFGVKGVCATLGTALTEEQARLLKRFAPKVTLAYDGDGAGQRAILRGLDVLKNEGIPADVLDFPDGLDPDEFIRREGAEGFARLKSVTPEQYRMRRLKEQFDLSTQEGRTGYARACAPFLKSLDPLDLENRLQELMVQTGFGREVLLEQIGRSAAPVSERRPGSPRPEPIRPEGREGEDLENVRAQEVIVSLLSNGQLPTDIVSAEDFDDPLLRHLYEALSAGASPASLVEEQATDQERARVSRLLMTPPSENTDQQLRMAKQCISRMNQRRLDREMQAIMHIINTKEGSEKQAAMSQYMALSDRLKKLKNEG
ncbi:MAG: DNA primase [Clostridia bacterium]|nr:DNA primase [Clostridia bacterium]